MDFMVMVNGMGIGFLEIKSPISPIPTEFLRFSFIISCIEGAEN